MKIPFRTSFFNLTTKTQLHGSPTKDDGVFYMNPDSLIRSGDAIQVPVDTHPYLVQSINIAFFKNVIQYLIVAAYRTNHTATVHRRDSLGSLQEVAPSSPIYTSAVSATKSDSPVGFAAPQRYLCLIRTATGVAKSDLLKIENDFFVVDTVDGYTFEGLLVLTMTKYAGTSLI